MPKLLREGPRRKHPAVHRKHRRVRPISMGRKTEGMFGLGEEKGVDRVLVVESPRMYFNCYLVVG